MPASGALHTGWGRAAAARKAADCKAAARTAAGHKAAAAHNRSPADHSPAVADTAAFPRMQVPDSVSRSQ